MKDLQNDPNDNHESVHTTSTLKPYFWAVGINLAYVLVELVSGWLSGSVALLADAFHNFQDVFSLGLAALGIWLTRLPSTDRKTYGYRKASILVSLTNAMLLVALSGGLIWEAIQKATHPTPVDGVTVIWVAGVGIVVNLGTAYFFHKDQHSDLNARAAFIHLLGDALVSLGVVVSGVLVVASGRTWIDPVVSVLVSLIILGSTWSLLRESINLSLDGVPSHLSLEAIRKAVMNVSGVQQVHDLHVWALSTHEAALSAHVLTVSSNVDEIAFTLREMLKKSFEIQHSTIQIEQQGGVANCNPAQDPGCC